MKPLEIVSTLRVMGTSTDEMNRRLSQDAVRAALTGDFAGLAFIANIVAGQSGDTAWRMGDLMTVADTLAPLRHCEEAI